MSASCRVIIALVAFSQLGAHCIVAGANDQALRAPPRKLVSRSSEFCRADSPSPFNKCWDTKPSGDTALCTYATTLGVTASAPCRCPDGGLASTCDIESPGGFSGSYGVAQCSEKTTYEEGTGPDSTSVTFCKKFVQFADWSGRVRPAGSEKTIYNSGWWRSFRCWWTPGYSWQDGQCESKDRYLGETCWDGGECNNEGVQSYDGMRMSCAKLAYGGGASAQATCVPSIYPVVRNECTCNWFDWNFFVACGSNDCNGHACVLSTGDGKKYCDYNTDNNW